jgi:type II secretory pathway predicted ATPase ExeA
MAGDRPASAAFADTTDPTRLWRAGPHGVTMGALREAIIRGDRLLVLLGAAGVGKTILINALVEDLAAAGVTVARLNFPVTDAADLVFAIALSLRLSSTPTTREALAEAVHGAHVTIVIDDAHAVGDAALEELTTLLEGHAGFAAILAGNDTLAARLGGPLTALSSSVQVLRTLNDDETARFIAHNAAAANVPGLAANLVPLVAAAAAGTPRVIMHLCRKVLDSGETPDVVQLRRWRDEIAVTDVDLDTIVPPADTGGPPPRSSPMWRHRAVTTGALALGIAAAALGAWQVIRPAPRATMAAPHTADADFVVDAPKPADAMPPSPSPPAPMPERTVVTPKTSVVVTPKARSVPRTPSAPAPRPTERVKEKADTAAASPDTNARTTTSDPGAVIDWLLKQPPRPSD